MVSVEFIPKLKMKEPMRPDSNIGRCVDGEFYYLPESDVLVGSSATDRCLSCKAVWDTGSMSTHISPDIAKKLGLIRYWSPFCREKSCVASLRLAPDLLFEDIDLTICETPKQYGVRIGMDIIRTGELCLIPDPEQYGGLFRFVTP